MSTFADKYATAPALREITAAEVKPGMVVRLTTGGVDWVGGAFMRVAKAEPYTDDIEAADGTTWATGLADRIELVEDVPDPREELAKRFADKLEPGKWTGLDTYGHDFYRRLADEVTRWADERGQS